MDSLGDPHTAYMDPLELQQATSQLQGEYEGIGAWVDATGAFLTIISDMPGYPAEKAGLQTGDQIIGINGKNMTGVDPNVVLSQVLGPAGSSVTLTIQRKDVAPFDVTLIREKITLKSVEGKMLDNNVAYISLIIFGDTTTQELKDSLTSLLAQNPKGLILDLRNNSGGYLETAIEVVSQFVGDGNALIEESANGVRTDRPVLPGGLALKIPLVVLVNEGTASAAEITAGAIQDHQRGMIIGVLTYKKGSVQSWIDLANNEGAIRVTTEHWLTPNGHEVNAIGITPDIIVEITKEDIAAKKDPQLDRAIQAILSGK
jgi:carboxyl-terminal processing protease